MYYRTRKYYVCRHVHASFSPEILQAGAVKGLKAQIHFQVMAYMQLQDVTYQYLGAGTAACSCLALI